MFYAFGVNQYNILNNKSDKNYDCIHAEHDCVRRLKKSEKCQSINIVVFRTNNKGDKLMMSKPCCNCLKTIFVTNRGRQPHPLKTARTPTAKLFVEKSVCFLI